jgi:hypothetical protein
MNDIKFFRAIRDVNVEFPETGCVFIVRVYPDDGGRVSLRNVGF